MLDSAYDTPVVNVISNTAAVNVSTCTGASIVLWYYYHIKPFTHTYTHSWWLTQLLLQLHGKHLLATYVCLWSRTYFLNTKSYERYQLCFIPSYVQGPQSYVAPALKLNLEISSSFNLAGIPSISTIPSETHLESFLQQQVIIRLTLIRAQC